MLNEFINRQKQGLCPICKQKLHKDDKIETVYLYDRAFSICARHLNPNEGVKNGYKMRRKNRKKKKSDKDIEKSL